MSHVQFVHSTTDHGGVEVIQWLRQGCFGRPGIVIHVVELHQWSCFDRDRLGVVGYDTAEDGNGGWRKEDCGVLLTGKDRNARGDCTMSVYVSRAVCA
jgi:hypothetical protein